MVIRNLDGDEGGDWEDTHGTLTIIAWFALENLTLWSMFFKNYRYGAIAHIFFASLLGGFFFIGGMMMIIAEGWGEVTEEFAHMTLGFILLILLPILMFTGALTKIFQLSPNKNPKIVFFMNWGHKLYGWAVMIIAKVPLYVGSEDELMVVMIIIDAISHGGFILFRFF